VHGGDAGGEVAERRESTCFRKLERELGQIAWNQCCLEHLVMEDRMQCTPITSDERRPRFAPGLGLFSLWFQVMPKVFCDDKTEAASRRKTASVSHSSISRGR
jgi:hypothetical protein